MSSPNPQSAPKKALEPDAPSQLMPPAKIDWRSSRWRAAKLFSLLVLVSAGLHGVAVLVPLPEQQEVIEKEEVLPEPIQVSTLPLEVPEEPPEAPEPLPADPPPPSPEPAPQIVIEQPIADPLPAALPEDLLEDPLADQLTDPVGDPPENTPPKDPEPKPQDPSVRQAFDAVGTTENEAFSALGNFFSSGGLGELYGLSFNDVKPVSTGGRSAPLLSMSYPADANSCFEDATSLSLTGSVAAIVGDFEDENGQMVRAVIDAQVLQKTGYAVVDQWLEDVVAGSEDADVDIYSVIKNNASNPVLEVGGPEELFSFKVTIELPDQPCG